MTCKDCKHFWAPEFSAVKGWCNRYPPQVYFADGVVHSETPKVSVSYRCGEFHHKETEE